MFHKVGAMTEMTSLMDPARRNSLVVRIHSISLLSDLMGWADVVGEILGEKQPNPMPWRALKVKTKTLNCIWKQTDAKTQNHSVLPVQLNPIGLHPGLYSFQELGYDIKSID